MIDIQYSCFSDGSDDISYVLLDHGLAAEQERLTLENKVLLSRDLEKTNDINSLSWENRGTKMYECMTA